MPGRPARRRAAAPARRKPRTAAGLHGRLRELAGLALARTGRTTPTARHEPPARPEEAPATPPAHPHDRTPPPPPPGPPLPRPAQLPFPPDRLVGRAEAVADLLGTLTTPRPGSITVATVTGTGGVGKSALTVHVAHRLRDHYPDGQLYANLRGTSADPADPAAVLAGFLQALGLHERDVPDGPHERAALFRTTVADRRILLVLDDARDTAQAEALLPGSATCAVLVTARATLDGLQAACRVRLEPLAVPDALAVLGEVAGRQRIAADPGQARSLAERCGGLPLALRLAGALTLSGLPRHPRDPLLPPDVASL
ncbi:NB-ARC domain-containing protein [Streptomyces lavendulae]|uniref:NB-ARC domain-containing protein n=1 Tax=Streptomyces lavendulae TaxID=1914 RepID=UPI003675115F